MLQFCLPYAKKITGEIFSTQIEFNTNERTIILRYDVIRNVIHVYVKRIQVTLTSLVIHNVSNTME